MLVLGVVGPCASGKSTLVAALRALNFHVRHIAQEHSYIPDMWQRIGKPDLLIYLDVSFEESARRTDATWTRDIFEKQIVRLQHARKHADLYINTDDLTHQQVLEAVLDHF
jgi:deoxyadenosine/deoxycytidine kinase